MQAEALSATDLASMTHMTPMSCRLCAMQKSPRHSSAAGIRRSKSMEHVSCKKKTDRDKLAPSAPHGTRLCREDQHDPRMPNAGHEHCLATR